MSRKAQERTNQAAIVSRGVWIVLAIAVVAISAFYLSRRQSASPPTRVGAASALSSGPSAVAGSFVPTVVNQDPAPGAVPEGMAWIAGGEFSMGANDPPDLDDVGMKATLDARPIHRVYVDGFFMDTTDVTNAQFEKFVNATGYVSIAERKPRAEDYPGAPPENLV